MNAAQRTNEPTVLCPVVFRSPFLEAASAFNSQYDELNKILRKIEELITQGKLEELHQAGNELLKEVSSRASREPQNYRVNDSHFSFTADRQSHQGYGYGQSHREATWHTVPFIGNAAAEDLSLYSAITKKNDRQIPLNLARALVEKFNWTFSLSEIQYIGIIPEIPKTIVVPGEIQIGRERQLVVWKRNENSAFELDTNWRLRGQPICKAIRESNDDKLWLKKSNEADLVRFGDKYIWLSTEAPSKAALLCPQLIQFKDHFEEIGTCLKLWRNKLGKPDDFSGRLKSWLESKPNSAPWIAHIAEMILVKFSPWPEPFNLRSENDSERDWSPEQCLKQVLPLFRGLARASLRATPPNLVKTFLYLIRRPNVDAHAYAGEFSDMWNFSVRTFDHSWINGEIIGNSTLGANSPLKFEVIESGYDDAEGYCISCAGIDCFISEERNQRR